MKEIKNKFGSSFFVNCTLQSLERYKSTCGIIGKEQNKLEILKILTSSSKNIIPFFDLNVNNVCSLRCKDCDQGMPYFNRRKIFSAEYLIANMERLLEHVDYVHQISILGGEPFLNHDLDQILKYCIDNEKIGSIIVVTNGTIYPDERILETLISKKVILGFSMYDLKDDTNRKKLLEYCKKHRIKIHKRSENWQDFGDFRRKRNYNQAELKTCFTTCFLRNCVQFNEGVLFRCTKTRLLLDQKIAKPDKTEYIKIKEIKSYADLHRKLRKFYSLPYLKACDYCNFGELRAEIPMGIQLNMETDEKHRPTDFTEIRI